MFSAKIIALTTSQLEQQSTSGSMPSEISFQNQLFVEGPSFPKQHYQKAIEYCRQYLRESKLVSLLVESDFCFTIWLSQPSSQLEEKDSTPETQLINWSKSQSSLVKQIFSHHKPAKYITNQVSTSDKELSPVREIPLPPEIKQQRNEKLDNSIETNNSSPSTQNYSQTTTRTYRGVSYPVDSSSSQAPHHEQVVTSTRTYRGLRYHGSTYYPQQNSSSSNSQRKKYRGQSY